MPRALAEIRTQGPNVLADALLRASSPHRAPSLPLHASQEADRDRETDRDRHAGYGSEPSERARSLRYPDNNGPRRECAPGAGRSERQRPRWRRGGHVVVGCGRSSAESARSVALTGSQGLIDGCLAG
jgi:hypothetical protein